MANHLVFSRGDENLLIQKPSFSRESEINFPRPLVSWLYQRKPITFPSRITTSATPSLKFQYKYLSAGSLYTSVKPLLSWRMSEYFRPGPPRIASTCSRVIPSLTFSKAEPIADDIHKASIG